MRSDSIRTTKPDRKTPALREQSTEPPARNPLALSPSPDDLHVLIEKRAYELYGERGYRHGYELDDWLEAEREILPLTPQAPDGHA